MEKENGWLVSVIAGTMLILVMKYVAGTMQIYVDLVMKYVAGTMYDMMIYVHPSNEVCGHCGIIIQFVHLPCCLISYLE